MARDVAINLEAAICKSFGPSSRDYGAKARTLLFNLQDPKNHSLKLKLMCGLLEPMKVVKMAPKELASEQAQQEREEIEKANLESRRSDWAQEQAKASASEGFFTCFKCGSKKTHFYQM